jgi:adenosylmethionine-8-amino-7-oxononanoate aminotransferase
MSRSAADAQWRHFTTAADHRDGVTIVRGEGCYVWDAQGRRYLDAIAGLHSVNVGYGPWPEIVEAARRQLELLPYAPNWLGFGNEPAERLAERLATLAPVPGRCRVFFSQSGSEAVETAMKMALQHHRLHDQPGRVRFISRVGAYHGTTLGALSLNGTAALRGPFEPLLGSASQVPVPYAYRCGACEGSCDLSCADEIERAIEAEGPESVAAVFIEPVQCSGGALGPPPGYAERVREICDRHGVLLVADETICAFGRVGEWFGSTRYGLRPDILTVAKGLTSSWAPLAATIATEAVWEPFFVDDERAFLHGSTFGGHPVSCAVALANLDVIGGEGMLGHVRRSAPDLRARCEQLAASHPLAGEVRGDGFFVAIELVRDKASRTPFSPAERSLLARRHLRPRTRELGVQMKFDERIELAAILTPPLIAGEAELELMTSALGSALDDAWDAVSSGALDAAAARRGACA